jgi:hypothetical protein
MSIMDEPPSITPAQWRMNRERALLERMRAERLQGRLPAKQRSPLPKGGRSAHNTAPLGLRVPRTLYNALKQYSDQQRKTLNLVCVELLSRIEAEQC